MHRNHFYDRKLLMALTVSGAAVAPLFLKAIVPDYRGPFRGQKEFQDRTVIVTGATGNIGASTSAHFAKRKFRVIMACRDMDACKMLRREIVLISKNNAIACRYLDLEDIDSINKFADEMIKNEPHINVLVNNAAVKHTKEKELTKYGIEKHYFVNFLAPFLLTFRLLDKLAESAKFKGDSRVINVIGTPKKDWKVVTSDINFDIRKYTSDAAYKQSKLALAYFTILLESYNKERENNIYVYGVSPCFKSIKCATFRAISAKDMFISWLQDYYKITADQASSNTAMCGIEAEMANRDSSGRLYTYNQNSWGWGKALKDLDHAKLVWNHAYNLLLNIPDIDKKIDSTDNSKTVESREQNQKPAPTTNKNG